MENKAKNPQSTHYELWNGFEAIDVLKRRYNRNLQNTTAH